MLYTLVFQFNWENTITGSGYQKTEFRNLVEISELNEEVARTLAVDYLIRQQELDRTPPKSLDKWKCLYFPELEETHLYFQSLETTLKASRIEYYISTGAIERTLKLYFAPALNWENLLSKNLHSYLTDDRKSVRDFVKSNLEALKKD